MKIAVETGTDRICIKLSGQLNTLTSVDFEKEVANAISSPFLNVVLDCSELSYISSAGLRLLLTLYKGQKAKGGTFVLQHVRKEIVDLLKTTGFSSFLVIEN
mgnify:CR=1 FL=1|jgi:anti-anti-sigma factor